MCSKYHVFFNIGLFLSNFKLYNPIFMISRLIASKDFLYTVHLPEAFQEVSSRIFSTTSSGVIERVTCKYFSIIKYSKYQLKYQCKSILFSQNLEVDRVCLLLPSWLGQCIYRL